MRSVLALLAVSLASALGIGATSAGHYRVIYVRDMSHLTDAQVKDAMTAFQAAIDKDFAPIWHVHAKLVFIGAAEAPQGSWRIKLEDAVPCLFCAGFHEYTGGNVRAEVSAGKGWQVTFTHELWEMLADPYAGASGQDSRLLPVGDVKYIVETADPVEGDQFAYSRKTRAGRYVKISDFVTPEWFDARTADGWVPIRPGGAWDFANHCTRPLQILPAGYQLIIKPDGSIDSLEP